MTLIRDLKKTNNNKIKVYNKYDSLCDGYMLCLRLTLFQIIVITVMPDCQIIIRSVP